MAALVFVAYPLMASAFYAFVSKFAPIEEDPVQLELVVNESIKKAA